MKAYLTGRIFYALMMKKQKEVRNMKPYRFETLGLMLDMSRNAVMSVEALKKYLPMLKKMGYNCVMLYTEDTYEVDREPYFGYMRGRYSMQELRELDAFAADLGIELIPCIQTLAHLNAFTRWKKIEFDIDDTLLVGDERSYEFIENLIRSVRSCFRTGRIHIGMDEAWKLGRGKYHNLNGCEDATSIMKKHLARVCEIVKRYDFEPMMWSDMFFRSICNNQYYVPKMEMPQPSKDALPSDVTPVYWDYYHEKEEEYDAMLCNHEQLSDKTWFAGGIWTWRGFLPCIEYSLSTMRPAIDACRKHKVKNIFFTMWGDNGAECSRYAPLPALFYLAEYARGNTDEERIKERFKRMFGVDFDAFMRLDGVNIAYQNSQDHRGDPKTALYSDYFNNFRDVALLPDFAQTAADTAQSLHATARATRRFGYLFDSAAKLCDVLAVKYELGMKTRVAYQAGDKAELLRLANEEYTEVLRRLVRFANAFEKQWYTENKTAGFEVQDVRLGGLLRRTDSCRRRLIDYAKGKIDRIEELEGELLELNKENSSTSYQRIAAIGSL